jgi:tetraprenyl-beta-curcumene synthase
MALVLANIRYWITVAPRVGDQFARWEERAAAIPDPVLRTAATTKLRDERFNAQLAATLATLSPRVHRARVVDAIVALQVLYDYVDLLAEQLSGESTFDDQSLFAALNDVVEISLDQAGSSPLSAPHDYYGGHRHHDDAGYVEALRDTVRFALGSLPGAHAVGKAARRSAARCAEAQLLHHRAPRSGIASLRGSATMQASGTGLGWQEFLAGASASVLALHALIVAAADQSTTPHDAAALEATYLSIAALTTLDSLIDREEDIATGQLGYLQYYDDPQQLASRLALLARQAVAQARELPDGAHHVVTLVGIVAYYASAPAAASDYARPVFIPLRRELAPLITPILTLMRAWRLAKRIRHA